MGSPEINPCFYGQLIFIKGGRSIKWSNNRILDEWCWEIWTAMCKKNETQPPTYTIHYYKINSRWIKDLNISCDTRKVLVENIGRKISDIPCSKIFNVMSPRARDIKERINKWDLIKIKSIFMAKENNIKMKTEPVSYTHLRAHETQ